MELSELIQKLESCKKASSTGLENANFKVGVISGFNLCIEIVKRYDTAPAKNQTDLKELCKDLYRLICNLLPGVQNIAVPDGFFERLNEAMIKVEKL